MKRCSGCGVSKALDEFHQDKNSKDKRARRCKPCANATSARWASDNPIRHRANGRRQHDNNRAANNAAARKRYERNPERDLDAKRKYRYGVDRAKYDAMIETQGGVCAICSEPSLTQRLHVDHDHATGAIRGLLCKPCNLGLGFFRDNPAALLAAIEYLSPMEARTR